MLRSYLKSAWRNIRSGGIYSVINIFGLSLGLSVFILILLYVEHESSYDDFHAKAGRMYMMTGKEISGDQTEYSPFMSYATAPLVKNSCPFVEDYLRLTRPRGEALIQAPQNGPGNFEEPKIFFADSNFFNFFSFRLEAGTASQVLEKPFTVVVSHGTAKKYFGDRDPIGQILRYNNKFDFTVTGVAEDVVSNSSLQFNLLASLSSLASIEKERMGAELPLVQTGSFTTYFVLKTDNNFPARLNSSLRRLHDAGNGGSGNKQEFSAVGLAKAHSLNASSPKYIKLFPYIAALVLLLALINFISLSTARFTLRAKEIGVRKVMGAAGRNIVAQFVIESAIVTAISFLAAIGIFLILKPLFVHFMETDISNSFMGTGEFIWSLCGLFLLTVCLLSAYPGFLLSSFQPTAALAGKLGKNSLGASIRKVCIVFQFTISIVLIICGTVVQQQIDYFRHADKGILTHNIVMIPFDTTLVRHYPAFKAKTMALSGVEEIATAQYPLYKGYDTYFGQVKENKSTIPVTVLSVDQHFIPFLGLKWNTQPSDPFGYSGSNSLILNETAVRNLNLGPQALKETVRISGRRYRVAGIIRDFNYESLEKKIGNLALAVRSENDSLNVWESEGGCMFIKIDGNVNIPRLMSEMGTIYGEFSKWRPFDYSFLGETFDNLYKEEDKLVGLSRIFISLAVCIALIGLFGLSTFIAQQRFKEIAIRKVLGAKVSGLCILLVKEFFLILLASIAISAPIAWWQTNRWLGAFAYHIQPGWLIFLMTDSVVVMAALLTVSVNTIKAALANPVISLRS